MLTIKRTSKKIKFGGSLPGITRVTMLLIKTCAFWTVVYIFDHRFANVNQYYTEVDILKKTTPMVHRVPLTKARTNLGQIVRRAHLNNECFILEKNGTPIAGIMDIDDMEDWLELQDPEVQKQIAEGYKEYRQGKSRSLDDFLTELHAGDNSEKAKTQS